VRIIYATPKPLRESSVDLHDWFESQSTRKKVIAGRRLAAILRIRSMERDGASRSDAIRSVAAEIGKSERTIWRWFSRITHHYRHVWLPALAPRHKGRIAKRRSDQ